MRRRGSWRVSVAKRNVTVRTAGCWRCLCRFTRSNLSPDAFKTSLFSALHPAEQWRMSIVGESGTTNYYGAVHEMQNAVPVRGLFHPTVGGRETSGLGRKVSGLGDTAWRRHGRSHVEEVWTAVWAPSLSLCIIESQSVIIRDRIASYMHGLAMATAPGRTDAKHQHSLWKRSWPATQQPLPQVKIRALNPETHPRPDLVTD
ncbi:hypothetical protein F5Y18DRAFT_105221 [Xylariaceae sp. FL1019]|nr:hypothetical protein F5Y18DRAFT_105221 [Xylariaceae sp. FL1019]